MIFVTTYPHPHRLHLRRPHVNLWLVAVVGLAAALIGLASWVVVDRYAGGSSATDKATTLIDKSNAAFSTGDQNAISAFFAKGAVMRSLGETYSGLPAIRGLADGSLTPERVAPVTMHGDFATTYVRITAAGIQAGTTLSVFEIKDGKILRQWNFAAASTPPFDNALVSDF
ncbi:MAG TPA: nuclear transport factor 2 family protein [Gaiellaceae bacterium]|nr:nuclear transport factor 2 family protein [Gaiellaceae bacterium]